MGHDLPAFMGTLPGWLTSAGVATLIGIILRFVLGNKKLDNDAAEQIRQHYDAQIKLLWERDSRIQSEADSRVQVIRDEYERQIKALRNEYDAKGKAHESQIKEMKSEIEGLRKQLITYEAAAMRNLPDEMLTPAMKQALRSLEEI